jgi:hypothetical protein
MVSEKHAAARANCTAARTPRPRASGRTNTRAIVSLQGVDVLVLVDLELDRGQITHLREE